MSSAEEDRLTVRTGNFFGLSVLAGETVLGRTSFARWCATVYGLTVPPQLVRF